MSDRINAAKKYVVTHRPESLAWGPFEGLSQEIVADIRRIKSQNGPDLILSGSSTLTSTLIEHGLADEVLLVVYPVLLGTGKRIFADGTPPRELALVSTKAMPVRHHLQYLQAQRAFEDRIARRRDIVNVSTATLKGEGHSNEKANVRDQPYGGWLLRPHQAISG